MLISKHILSSTSRLHLCANNDNAIKFITRGLASITKDSTLINSNNFYGNIPHSKMDNAIRKKSTECDGLFERGNLLQKIVDVTVRDKLNIGGADETQKVVDFKTPKELQQLLDLPFDSRGCEDFSQIEEIIEKVVRYSVKTGNPHFHNQLYGGLDEVGLASGWLMEALNTNQHTFEVAPCFIMMEHHLIKQVGNMFGYKDPDGIFGPGGSALNLYGLAMARHRKYPELKTTGLFGKKELVLFTSDMCHYSIQKAAFWMGYGTDQVVSVQSDENGRMDPGALRAAVKECREGGREPLFVNATVGTTVFGAIDPLPEIADICEKEGLWMHVDACWGGAIFLSEKEKPRLKGIERADSIAWNAHKMLSIPLQCSLFLLKEKGLLDESLKIGATYLFQQDKCYDISFDTGDKSIQCGRKADALKLWLNLKIHGTDVFRDRIDAGFNAARHMDSEITKREGFRSVVSERDCLNVCFWYIPPSMRGQTENKEWWDRLHKVSPKIKERMVHKGSLLIGYNPMVPKNLVNFFRMIISTYPVPDEKSVEYVLDEIEELGKDL